MNDTNIFDTCRFAPNSADTERAALARFEARHRENDRALQADLRAAGLDDHAARAAAFERHDNADRESYEELCADLAALRGAA